MNSDIRIEHASLSDLEGIMEIENGSFDSDAFSERQLAYLISKSKGAFFVVKYQERTVAYLSLLTSRRTNNLRIYSIAVHPEMRGQKLAQRLIGKSIEYANEKNLKAVTLEVKTTNTAAINLYKKNNFRETGLKQNYYHDGANAYTMSLCL